MTTNKEVKKIEFARSIIEKEIEALQNLPSYIDDDFAAVVDSILESKGRVVITGIGKSAIIGTKIVATLNSTGTPACFMHAADAIHGDLGMIQPSDVVICISKSGNTPEIKALVPLIRNLGHKNLVVAMVGNLNSFLALSCDKVLNTSAKEEACPLNLAPTTSTTMQLVMGDALAMTLLECRGFSCNDFAKAHPGGSLGKRLYLKVGDLINSERSPKIDENSSIDEVIFEISSKMVGATAVINQEGALVGVITDGDIRRMLQNKPNLETIVAKDIMSHNPKSVSSDALAYEAFSIMENNKITQLLATDNVGNYCGVIHIHDILKEGVI